MLLNFPRALVEQLLQHTLSCKGHTPLHRDQKTARPGLWLVGDDGVYLMSNGEPGLRGADETHIVAYANEVNSKTMAFDDWWRAKQMSFGGDDGTEFWDANELTRALATYKPGQDLILDVTPDEMSLITFTPQTATAPTRDKVAA